MPKKMFKKSGNKKDLASPEQKAERLRQIARQRGKRPTKGSER